MESLLELVFEMNDICVRVTGDGLVGRIVLKDEDACFVNLR